MQLLRSAFVLAWLVAAGPTCFHSFVTGHQVQVRIPMWDVGGLITQVTGYMKGQDTGHPPKKKKRPHHEEQWPPYGYYDPALMYPPYYYPYPPYPPPTRPPWPPTTQQPPETTTTSPTETTTTGEVPTTQAPVTTTVAPIVTTTVAPIVTTTVDTPDGTTEPTTETPPGRDLCQIYPLLPECQALKVHRKKSNQSSSVLQPDQKLSTQTKPHSMTSLCFYYPRLCMRPEEAQFVSLKDENGRPLLLISPVDKKSELSQG